jgi:hypothetical protein
MIRLIPLLKYWVICWKKQICRRIFAGRIRDFFDIFNCMKKLLFIGVFVMLLTVTVTAQPEKIGAGLTFATKKRFNGGDTGNPGLNIRTWIPIDKRRTFYVVPSATVFNYFAVNHTKHLTTNYMFHGDLELQYTVFTDKTLKLAAAAGLNYTHIASKVEPVIIVPNPPQDSTVAGFGPTIGAALEMRMSPYWDFVVSGKYSFAGLRMGDASLGEKAVVAPLSAPIIQVHAVYYFFSRGSHLPFRKQ